ncbi:hypothetical protein ACIGMX_28200 [Streptomyces aquilus]|uniref:hypothetical protein n=1 Tax=Streptomyces aquilus TaxID=2548456 RepID=UPI0037CD35FD
MASQNGTHTGCLKVLVLLLTLAGALTSIGYAMWRSAGEETGGAPPVGTNTSAASQEWAIGDCGGPDPDRAPGSYKRYECGDPDATFQALKIEDADALPGAVQCPVGTDLVVEVSWSYGPDDSGSVIPTDTLCGRNLSTDHPGDAGAGGGQLVKGDCMDQHAQEIPCADAGKDDLKVLALVEAATARCPSGTTTPMQLTIVVGRPYDTICGAPL